MITCNLWRKPLNVRPDETFPQYSPWMDAAGTYIFGDVNGFRFVGQCCPSVLSHLYYDRTLSNEGKSICCINRKYMYNYVSVKKIMENFQWTRHIFHMKLLSDFVLQSSSSYICLKTAADSEMRAVQDIIFAGLLHHEVHYYHQASWAQCQLVSSTSSASSSLNF